MPYRHARRDEQFGRLGEGQAHDPRVAAGDVLDENGAVALYGVATRLVAGFPGCRSLMLLTDGDEQAEGVLRATLSHWDSADALDAYRSSELFGVVWPATKALFAAPPVVETFAEWTRGKV